MVPTRKYLWLVVAAVVLAALAGTTVVWRIVVADAGQIANGVSVQEVKLGGLDRRACIERLTAADEELAGTTLELRFDGRSWEVALGRLGVSLDIEGIADEALAVGRRGLFVNQWLERHRIKQKGVTIPLRLTLSEDVLRETVSGFMDEYVSPPVNAGFRVTAQDTVVLVPDRVGTGVDYAALGKAVLQSAKRPEPPPVDIAVIEVWPEHTLDDVRAMRLNGLIAQYTTRFNPSLVDRSYNIAVAARAFDNLLVAPGEVVSFNEIVGPRSREAGYRSAPIIVNDEFEEGMGGGVCQVSSTLYNAVLLADLEIIERKNHSLPIAYIPIGRDATVVYGAVDLKFRNNTKGSVFLKTAVGNGSLTIKIFGDAENFPKVEIRSWITETIAARVIYEDDEMLEIGEEVVKRKGVNGYRVKAERWVWRDGAVEKSALPGSFYNPQHEVIAVGTREAPPPVVAPVPGPDPWLPRGPSDPGGEPGTGEPSAPDGPDSPDNDADVPGPEANGMDGSAVPEPEN